MTNTHEWCAEGITAEKDSLRAVPVSTFPWWLGRLTQNENIDIPRVADLPAAASAERDVLERQGVVSLIVVPMHDGKSLVGFLGFDAVRGEGAWKEGTLALLRIVGQVFVDALRRERSEREREDYISAISHDLRAPLTVILGQAQIVQRMPDRTPLVERSAEAIAANARRLNTMIQALVDSARLQSGHVQLNSRAIDLAGLARELIERLTLAMGGQPGQIRVEGPADLPRVLADPDSLDRILTNLLTNALRYSEAPAEVTIRLSERDGEVIAAVIDRGQGIAEEDMPHLFERYYRGQAGRGERESLGLGLYITRELVQAHGGRVWAESRLGEGSTFYFTLPADLASPAPSE